MQRLKFQTFTSSGTFTTPGGISTLFILARGAGAGGCMIGTVFPYSSYAPGGGGCWSNFRVVTAVPNTSYSVTIGAGGAGATTANTVGAAGGATTFGSLAIFKGAIPCISNGDVLTTSIGMTMGGNYGYNHLLVGGQASPFGLGGAGFAAGSTHFGGGGAGDGFGPDGNPSGAGNAGTQGAGGSGGLTSGGAGGPGQLIVCWID